MRRYSHLSDDEREQIGEKTPNGRLRRWLPRQTDIDKVSDEEIQDIVITAKSQAQKMSGLRDPFSGAPQRAWQGRANPVCIALLGLRSRTTHSALRLYVRRDLRGGPSHGMQDTRIEPASRHGASCMGDGPDEFYHLRWTRCAQDDNCCCGSRGRTLGRGAAVGDLGQSRRCIAQDGRPTGTRRKPIELLL